ncbi:MAG: DUF507 family protein [Deltaproteobacteria bacterium]|nr:DUF507 family protein [Deltaproteobacteria bacterium]
MKIYSKLLPKLGRDIVRELLDAGDIEIEPENVPAAEEDFAAIVGEYLRQDAELNESAKDLLARRGWNASKFGEARRVMAETRRFPIGDDGVDYVIEQMLEFMMISSRIEEVFAPDHAMRKRIVGVLRRYMQIDDEVDTEVRKRLKHLQEGTRDWEIQYQRTAEQVRRNKGLI